MGGLLKRLRDRTREGLRYTQRKRKSKAGLFMHDETGESGNTNGDVLQELATDRAFVISTACPPRIQRLGGVRPTRESLNFTRHAALLRERKMGAVPN